MTKLKIAALIASASLGIFAAACATGVVNDNGISYMTKPANTMAPATPRPANTAPANSNMKMPSNSNMKMPTPRPSATKKP